MRKRIRSRVDVLENEERSRKLDQQSLAATISFFHRKIVLAYYLGGLKPNDEDPGEAEARALNYGSRNDYLEALFNRERQEIDRRFKYAARRLFGQVGLDFDRSPPGDLIDSFVQLVKQLPQPRLKWLQSNLQEACRSAPIGNTSNRPLEFFSLQLQQLPRATNLSRKSRVFTQICQPLFSPIPEDLLREECKACFWTFRRYMRPTMKCGWWQHEVATELQRFYCSLINGKRPKLILMAPPQHGKTEQVKDLVAWIAGKRPDLKTIFASYSEDLGVTVNKDLQRIMTSERYVALFGDRLGDSGSRWLRNANALEYVNHWGSFRNTTVEGQITGQGLDIGIVDDPLKGRAEANNKAVRDKTWGWFTDDFLTRFSNSAGLLMIMTRWHLDDPVGRFIQHFRGAKILRYPAIAEEDEKHRRTGEALFPQHKSLSFLMERKAMMTQAGWESEYQQNPIMVGGGMFPIEKFNVVPTLNTCEIKRSVRYWDKAGTADGGAFTVGVLMHLMQDGRFIVGDVRRGQWSALDRERVIKSTAEMDRKAFPRHWIWFEQEPGSSGKESAEATIRMLGGWRVRADRVTGNKVDRAEPYAAQVQAGNVLLLAGEWKEAFLDEHETFPAGKYKDQVDASAGAFTKLTTGSTYDSSMMWVTHTDGKRDPGL
jgi:predicted phage terminase large subunit-like protein